jgi:hypothetical protein
MWKVAKKHLIIIALGCLTALTYIPDINKCAASIVAAWVASAVSTICSGFNVKNREFDTEVICFSAVSLFVFICLSVAFEFPRRY